MNLPFRFIFESQVSSPPQRLTSQLLMGLMLLLNLGACFSTLGFWWSDPVYFEPQNLAFWTQSATLLAMPLFYWYSRTNYYRYVAVCAGLFIMLWTLITVITPPYYPNAMMYFFATQLLFLVFIGEKAGLLSLVGGVVLSLLVIILHPHIHLYDVDILFLAIMGGLLQIVYRYRSYLFFLQQKELAASELRYKQLVELNPDPVVVHDGEKYLYLNPAAIFLESNPSLRQIIEPQIAAHFLQKGVFRDAYQYLGEYHFEVASAPIDYNGQMARLFISRDITHRHKFHQHELELRLEKERVELLQGFIRDVTHDLRTPITAIQTKLYLLTTHTALDQKQRQHLQVIEHLTERLNTLIEDLITMMQLDRHADLQTSPLDWHTLLNTLKDGFISLAQQKGQRLILEHDPQTPPILADSNQLYRAFGNLLENAIRYTPQDKTIHLRVFPQGQNVICEIKDEGLGILPADLPHIFERFYRSDQARSMQTGGSGLGLAIVQRIIQMHKAQIEVESEAGKGTCFRIIFPR